MGAGNPKQVDLEINMQLKDQEIFEVINFMDRLYAKRDAQQRRGLNDFNIFTILLSIEDEIRLHSRFICYLLDPSASHGQGYLFLELFLKHCNIDLDLKFESVSSVTEHNYIDIYLTDGSRHLIIENKIYAGDQEHQVERYIDFIINENRDDDQVLENMCFVYLSLDGVAPGEYSRGRFKMAGDCLVREDQRIRFRSIHYRDQILPWIQDCLVEVSNITNLSVGLGQYRDVILKLYGEYQEKLMTLKQMVEKWDQAKNEITKIEFVNRIDTISNEYLNLRPTLMDDFFNCVERLLKIKIQDSGVSWQVGCETGKMKTAGGFPLYIRMKQKDDLLFGFEFSRSDYKQPFFGLVRWDSHVDLKRLGANTKLHENLSSIDHIPAKNSTSWWLRWQWYVYPQGAQTGSSFDLFKSIIEFGKQEVADDLVQKIWSIMEKYEVENSYLSDANRFLKTGSSLRGPV